MAWVGSEFSLHVYSKFAMVHPHSSISALRRPNSAGQGVLGAGGPKLRARPQRPEDQARLGDHQDRGELTALGSNLFLLNLFMCRELRL